MEKFNNSNQNNHDNKKDIVALNKPVLEIDGIEELEERLEMRQICGADCCSNSFYGSC